MIDFQQQKSAASCSLKNKILEAICAIKESETG